MVLHEVRAHLADHLARADGPGAAVLEHLVRDLRHRVVADAELVFVDVGVVDAVDRVAAEQVVVGADVAAVVPEAEALEEILVHDVRAGRYDGVHHPVLDHVDEHFGRPRRAQRAGHAGDDRALLVGEHHVVDPGGAAQVAGLERHVGHGVHDRAHVVLLDVDPDDQALEQVLLGGLGHESSWAGGKNGHKKTATLLPRYGAPSGATAIAGWVAMSDTILVSWCDRVKWHHACWSAGVRRRRTPSSSNRSAPKPSRPIAASVTPARTRNGLIPKLLSAGGWR